MSPTTIKVPFSRPNLGQAERRAVLEVLDSGWLTSGPVGERLERGVAAYLGRGQGVALSSCTAALTLCLHAWGVAPGAGVAVPAMTFAATAEAVVRAGAVPVLVEVDPATRLLDPAWLERLLADPGLHPLARRGMPPPPIQAVVPVHHAGLMADMAAIAALAERHGLLVFEDAAHAMPAFRPGPVRTVKVGDLAQAACLSFYANKCITTAEGGMIVTDDRKQAERLRRLRLHGLDRDAAARHRPGAGWRIDVTEVGFKCNLPDLCAALGLAQLDRADALWSERRRLAGRYRELLAGLPLELPNDDKAEMAAGGPGFLEGHSWHLYPVRLPAQAASRREALLAGLAQDGVATAVHFTPLHLMSAYRAMGYAPGDFPGAEAAFAGVFSLPLFPGMSGAEQEYVARCLAARL